jgi:hypothetical protein
MTPFQLMAGNLAKRGVTTNELSGDRMRPTGTIFDLARIAGAVPAKYR